MYWVVQKDVPGGANGVYRCQRMYWVVVGGAKDNHVLGGANVMYLLGAKGYTGRCKRMNGVLGGVKGCTGWCKRMYWVVQNDE
jgi:hypothetical protein